MAIIDDIKKILDYAIWAPSGDNSQPWRFEVEGNTIKVFNIPERDTSFYNYNQNASLVALGSLIENIKIISPYYGYTPSINLLPESTSSTLIATVVLKESQKFNDPLYPYIKTRASNRKPYETRALSTEEKQEILRNDTITGVSIKLVDDRETLEKLADAASVNEKVVLENKKLHEFLFHSITWNEKEDKEKRGFFIKTLELKGPQIIGFKLFKHWPILQLFNKLGASNLVSRDNAKLYKQSGTFVAIIANDTTPISFLKTGMAVQRFWLQAARLNLGAQPITGVLFLHHRITTKENSGLSNKHIALIEKACSVLESVFETKGKQIIMMFRAGYADKPSAKCLRHDPEIKVLGR